MSNITLFNAFPPKGQPHYASEHISINDFLNFVKYGKWKHLIEPIRTEPDKLKRDKLKRNIPSVTISGVFEERAEANLLEHSGFICIDIDYFTDKSQLLTDQYTYALMKSASGGGLAVIVKVRRAAAAVPAPPVEPARRQCRTPARPLATLPVAITHQAQSPHLSAAPTNYLFVS